MTLGLTVVGISLAALAALVSLFRVEEACGHRVILSSVRRWLDELVILCAEKLSKLSFHLGTGTFRATFHYVIHRMLNIVINILTRAQDRIARLQMRNKHIAKIVREESDKTHLDAIAAHKEETSLSEEEKRQRRLH